MTAPPSTTTPRRSARPARARRAQEVGRGARALPGRPVPADHPHGVHPGDHGLRADAHHRRPDHRGAQGGQAARRPAGGAHPARPATTGPSSCSTSSTSATSSRQLRHHAVRPPAGHQVLTHLRRRDPRARVLRADRRVHRRHPARPARRLPPRQAPGCRAAHLRDPRLRHPGVLRRPAAQARSSPSGSTCCRSPAAPRRAPSSPCSTTLENPPASTSIDAIRTGDPAVLGDVLAARGPAGPRARPAHGRRLPAAGAHQRHLHPRRRLRRGGPVARRVASAGWCASTPTSPRSSRSSR